jgi:hypothetical protein
MANIPLNTQADCNAFINSALGLRMAGAAGAMAPALNNLPAPQIPNTRFNNTFNFCRPVIYGVLDAVTQMGENDAPMEHLIRNVVGRGASFNDFNRFYDVIYRPYTQVGLDATSDQNLWQQVLNRIITPLLINANAEGTIRRCGPIILVAGGEALNTFTMHKYHSLRTNDVDTNITHRDYYVNGDIRRWSYSSGLAENDIRATGAIHGPTPPGAIAAWPTTTQRLFLFRCLFYFLLERALRLFYVHQQAGTAAPQPFAAQYRLNAASVLQNINGYNFNIQSYTNNGIINWNNVFAGNQNLTANRCFNSLTMVMRIAINPGNDGADSIIETPIICYQRCPAGANQRAGNDLGVYRFLDPRKNGCFAHAWNSGVGNARWVNSETSRTPNYMHCKLNFHPMRPRPGDLTANPLQLFGPFTNFPGAGMHPNWSQFLSSDKTINMVTLGYLLMDQTKMILVSEYLRRIAGAQAQGHQKLLKYKQKISYLYGTLGITYINQQLLNYCQSYRINANNINPTIDSYLGGTLTRTKKIDNESVFTMKKTKQDNSMSATAIFNFEDMNKNDSVTETDDDDNNDNLTEGDTDEFDTLSSSIKQNALEFSKELFKKAESLGDEKMNEYLSSFTATNDTEFYGYLNYLSFDNPELKDYRIGLISTESTLSKRNSRNTLKRSPSKKRSTRKSNT